MNFHKTRTDYKGDCAYTDDTEFLVRCQFTSSLFDPSCLYWVSASKKAGLISVDLERGLQDTEFLNMWKYVTLSKLQNYTKEQC